MASFTVTLGVLTIKNQTLDQKFVDDYIDSIHTLVLDSVQLDNIVSYDIFSSLVNLKTIRIINSSLTTKQLNNLLYYVNAYSVYHLDLTSSSFNEKDLIPIKSSFALGTLILPDGMDETDQKILKQVLNN
jgi:hypothetical protein